MTSVTLTGLSVLQMIFVAGVAVVVVAGIAVVSGGGGGGGGNCSFGPFRGKKTPVLNY